MIKFITESDTNKSPVFADVDDNQFFVDTENRLCQKETYETYVIITNRTGKPHSLVEECIESTMPILRILPKIVKIEY